MISVTCLLLVVTVLLLQGSFLSNANEAKKIGDSCVTTQGKPGKCTRATNCEYLADGPVSEEIAYCFYDEEVIICCQNSEPSTTPKVFSHKKDEPPAYVKETISYKKCVEYSEHAYITRPSMVVGDKPFKELHCGFEIQPLVIGGVEAVEMEFPHMAVIGYGKPNNISWSCGGSLISDRYILTAAHCNRHPSGHQPVLVRLGVLNVNEKGEIGLQDRNINRFILHPEYKMRSSYNDIALIQLEQPVQFSIYVRPVCIHVEDTIERSKAIASGWGKTSLPDEKGSDKLLKVVLPLTPQNNCVEYYQKSRILANGILWSQQFCAGIIAKDTCQGDSGGPLQIYRTDIACMYDLVGIKLCGKYCGLISSVYTRVSNYRQWIEKVVWPEDLD